MKMYKDEHEAEVDKSQAQLMEEDGWSKTPIVVEVEESEEESNDEKKVVKKILKKG